MYEKKLIELTDEMFEQLTQESDYYVSAFGSAHPCCDRFGKFEYYKAFGRGVDYKMTTEQKDRAVDVKEARKRELIEAIKPGELVFVAMGCEMSAPDGYVNNHRVQCHFRNKKGRRYFVEFSSMTGIGKFFCEFSIDRDLEELRNQKLYDFIKENKGRLREHNVRNELKRLETQDYYHAFGLDKEAIDRSYTWDNIVKIINKVYDCDYKSARLLEYFMVSSGDFCNVCEDDVLVGIA